MVLDLKNPPVKAAIVVVSDFTGPPFADRENTDPVNARFGWN
jgi:hypothetical protein